MKLSRFRERTQCNGNVQLELVWGDSVSVGERNEEDEEAGGVRPAEAGREYQVNTLTLTFTFRRTINVETIG